LFKLSGDPASTPLEIIPQGEKVMVFGYTPDGSWLAYAPITPKPEIDYAYPIEKLVLVSGSGERIERMLDITEPVSMMAETYILRTLIYNSYWVDNENMYLVLGLIKEKTKTSYLLPTIYNPFTDTWSTGYQTILPSRSPNFDIEFAVSPDLSRGIYATLQGLVMVDLETGELIWHEPDYRDPRYTIIRWTADGSKAVAANLYVVAKYMSHAIILPYSGKEGIQIVDPDYPVEDFSITTLSWSPEGRYLAVYDYHNEDNSLYIFDSEQQKYILKCPLYQYELVKTQPRLFWSPDGVFVGISAKLGAPLQLLNIINGELLHLMEDVEVVGWERQRTD
jgi:hypothetical protein